MTLGETLDYVSGTLVSGNKITVPVTPGSSRVLEVIAYNNGQASVVFTHEFRGAEPTSKLFHGVYNKAGYSVSVAEIGFKATGVMDIDITTYPPGEYIHKVFCWNEFYVPIFDAITIG
jgi:hypothetical protein